MRTAAVCTAMTAALLVTGTSAQNPPPPPPGTTQRLAGQPGTRTQPPTASATQSATGGSTGAATAAGSTTSSSSSVLCALDGSSANITWDRTSNSTYVVVTTNMCPAHHHQNQIGSDNSNATQQPLFTFYLPKTLVFRKSTYGVNNKTIASQGPIGVSLSGATFYGPLDAKQRDAGNYEIDTFDWNGGHSDGLGRYHYHVNPWAIEKNGTSPGTGHSPLVGFMPDGFPIYGLYSDNGITPTDLDECGGHYGDAVASYHYHFRGPAGPFPQSSNGANITGFPYTPSCLRGCVPDTLSKLQVEPYAVCVRNSESVPTSAGLSGTTGTAETLNTTVVYVYSS